MKTLKASRTKTETKMGENLAKLNRIKPNQGKMFYENEVVQLNLKRDAVGRGFHYTPLP